MKLFRIFTVAPIAAVVFALGIPSAPWAQERPPAATGGTVMNPPARAAAPAMATSLKSPTTPLELLQNIKLALDQGLPLREDFYTDANLMRMFGGRKVEVVTDDPTAGPKDTVRQLSDFGSMAAPVKVGNFTISGITLVVHRSVANDGKISASLSLELLRPPAELDFDRVTGVFGKNWIVPKKPKMPHMKPAAPRKDHGNAEIEYAAAGSTHEFTFNPDAILGAATFLLNGKN